VILGTAVNYLSVKISGAIQMALTSIKVATIVLIVVGGFLFGTKHVEDAATAVPDGTFVTRWDDSWRCLRRWFGDVRTTGSMTWASREEVIDAHKNIPRAILIGSERLAFCICSRMQFISSLEFWRRCRIDACGFGRHSDIRGTKRRAGADVAMAISALAHQHVVVMTGARIPYAMARTECFFSFASRLQPKLRTPQRIMVFAWHGRCVTGAERNLRAALFRLSFCAVDLHWV